MFGIFRRFRRLLGRGAAEEFNRMAAFLTHFCSNGSINFDRPDDPSSDNPPCISVNEDWLEGRLGNCLQKSDVGTTSDKVAAGDHTHDLADLDNSSAGFQNAQQVSDAITAALSGITMPSDVLTDDDVGSTVQEHSASLDALAAELDQNGKVPLSQLTGNIQGHSGECLVTIDDNGDLGHGGNDAYDVLLALTSKSTVTNHVATLPFPEWATGATKANVIVGTDSNGDLKNVASFLTTAPTTDKVLTVKKNGTTVTWEDAGGGAAENPSSTTSLANAAPGTATVNSTTWTAGGTKGVVVRQHTRTMWNGTYLYGFYRDFVFDKNGRLYSVSGETRYTIDTPTKVTWN